MVSACLLIIDEGVSWQTRPTGHEFAQGVVALPPVHVSSIDYLHGQCSPIGWFLRAG